uniref:Uncharacterized protein n=1 Tax=Tanacetum cinerariifolium TaxID=118510 RepID=A0A6L2M9P0_TANCI|nr:hypothetical protein [Tanacetum cinerariifolium]
MFTLLQVVAPKIDVLPKHPSTTSDEMHLFDMSVDPYVAGPLFVVPNTNGDGIERCFFPCIPGLYYVDYPEKDLVGGSYQISHKEYELPYDPAFKILNKELFMDLDICKVVVDQFPTPVEMKAHDDYNLKSEMKLKGLQQQLSFVNNLTSQVAYLKKKMGTFKENVGAKLTSGNDIEATDAVFLDYGDLYKLLLVKVMAALIIFILSDSSKESVGFHAPRVILFRTIPAIIPVIPEAVKKRFEGNAITKKTQRNLLKQQYEIFIASSSEIDTLSLDNHYNNLKIYEPEVKGTSRSNTNTQNVAFVSLNSTNNTTRAVNTAHGATTAATQATAVNSTTINNLSNAVICAFFASQPNSPNLDNEDLQQIHPDDLEEMDLRCQMAMLTMKAKRFLKNTRRKFSMNSNETIRFDKFKVECYNFHKKGHFAKECRALRYQENRNRESSKRSVPMETPTSSALVSCDGISGYDWSDQAEEGPSNFALMAYSSISSNSESVEARLLVYKNNESVYEEDIKVLKRNFMPPKPDLSFSGLEEFVNEHIVREPTVKKHVVETSGAKASADKPKVVRKNFSSPLTKDWISDSEDEAESKPKIEKKLLNLILLK